MMAILYVLEVHELIPTWGHIELKGNLGEFQNKIQSFLLNVSRRIIYSSYILSLLSIFLYFYYFILFPLIYHFPYILHFTHRIPPASDDISTASSSRSPHHPQQHYRTRRSSPSEQLQILSIILSIDNTLELWHHKTIFIKTKCKTIRKYMYVSFLLRTKPTLATYNNGLCTYVCTLYVAICLVLNYTMEMYLKAYT